MKYNATDGKALTVMTSSRHVLNPSCITYVIIIQIYVIKLVTLPSIERTGG